MTGPGFSDRVMDVGRSPSGHAGSGVCGAQLRQPHEDRTTCARPAGWGTSHKGTGTCSYHLGNAASHIKSAERQQAVTLLGTLGVVADPASLPTLVVHAELQLSAAKQLAAVRWLEQQVGQLRPEQVDVSPWPGLLRDARRDSDKLLVDLARLGLDVQRVQLEQRRVDVMILVIQRALAAVAERVETRLGFALPELAGEAVGPLVHAAITDVGGELV